jgi:hypothetical protein
MEKTGKRVSVVRLYAELVEESIILVFLELKLAVMEIKRHIHSAEHGAVWMAIGAGLLFLGLVTFIGTAVAALAVILPVWLSALIVASCLAFLGIAFLFSGLGKLKDFSLVPSETLERMHAISQKLKNVPAQHKTAEIRVAMEELSAPERRTVPERRRVQMRHAAPERRSVPERRSARASGRRLSATAKQPDTSELKQKAA